MYLCSLSSSAHFLIKGPTVAHYLESLRTKWVSLSSNIDGTVCWLNAGVDAEAEMENCDDPYHPQNLPNGCH